MDRRHRRFFFVIFHAWLAEKKSKCFISCVWSDYSDLTRVSGPQKVANWKGNGTPCFREIQVGEILFHLARWVYVFVWRFVLLGTTVFDFTFDKVELRKLDSHDLTYRVEQWSPSNWFFGSFHWWLYHVISLVMGTKFNDSPCYGDSLINNLYLVFSISCNGSLRFLTECIVWIHMFRRHNTKKNASL